MSSAISPCCAKKPATITSNGATLSIADMFRARQLSDVLSATSQFMVFRPGQHAQVTMGTGRIVRGPEGQPLIPVPLGGRNSAYVDPNTNQYFLGRSFIRGGVKVQGPFTLPGKVQFSNSHFSARDVQLLTDTARRAALQSPPTRPHTRPTLMMRDAFVR